MHLWLELVSVLFSLFVERRKRFKTLLEAHNIPETSALMSAQAHRSHMFPSTAAAHTSKLSDAKAVNKAEGTTDKEYVEEHGYLSSDPEEYFEADLFVGARAESMAEDLARVQAANQARGLSESDDFSEGDAEDCLAGQTIMSVEDIQRRREAHLVKLRHLYHQKMQRLQQQLSLKRLAYEKDADELRSSISRVQAELDADATAQLRAQGMLEPMDATPDGEEEDEDADEDGTIPIPAHRQALAMRVPRELDLDELDTEPISLVPTRQDAALLVRKLRTLPTPSGSHAESPKPETKTETSSPTETMDLTRPQAFRCIFEARASSEATDGAVERCPAIALPFSQYCRQHILKDEKQQLYVPDMPGRPLLVNA
ncbi:uncharacterized protein MONBRDRAFT_31775, partial [Monosiga brevicollis MX1]